MNENLFCDILRFHNSWFKLMQQFPHSQNGLSALQSSIWTEWDMRG